MDIWKRLIRLWAWLTLASLVIDGGCVWLDSHAEAQTLLADHGINHLTLFLWSAPAPFLLALLLLPIGAAFTLLHWLASQAPPLPHLHRGHLHGLR